mmetsp:Transcript_19695/g.58125  ORF Transcript_19695/g.58125 Transcript_19695/m.58125 type:complete len:261 (+) Transcript_19695:24-806(+)|eukprot:CAMPEP_0206035626 /NCGR_PEP_ID=MMETSP1466-20131121/2213_1 /ASSEMBLY_ACC=CAM_ASM_001126 /TAXON_ID=44452 /ORGANISM="Pavlova gyrans, Strain CCMP608" /LENGTH=260 /DNA_ID=CAMNT_0053410025 /DNA_START=46 /DNA_END=828 /DNA_ORIENTATION=-
MGVRGAKRHLKRLNAPKHWMLDKLGGVWAPKPSAGPHKARECVPLIVLLRNRLKYALTYHEAKMIVKQRLVSVDGKARTEMRYPAGFMDVVSIDKTNEHFRLLYDVRGRFAIHRIQSEEAKYKLCRVKTVALGLKKIPYIVTHDGRTIRYPDPQIKVADTVKIDIESGKVTDFLKFDIGNLAMAIGGKNSGRVGVIVHRERHPGSFEIVHLKDATGNVFATRMTYVFVIGKGSRPFVSLPKSKGIKLTIVEQRAARPPKN